jgi:DNA-3-methyladenine glycosylase II|tara:strand:- start:1700 stop:2302 length:603 start_codon:yes stop_codon:yes gene_type:complete
MNSDFTPEEKFLIKRDKVLSKVIKTNGSIKFSKSKKDPFDTFVEIIISQFISTLAAKSIKEKMLENFKEKNFKVENFENLSVAQIKNLGLSLNKAKSIKAVIRWLEMESMKKFFNLSQAEREKSLLKIFGIGPWSVDMFEMFCIRNKNIFSYGDAALRQAMIQIGMVDKDATQTNFETYAKKWDPYKTFACLHLWEMIES